jgi:hypothetical protein
MPLISQATVLSSFLGSFFGFLLGLISAWLLERLKRWREKQCFINLFLAEIGRTNLEIDEKKHVPTGQVLARAKSELFGIGDVTLTGKPEYELEVYHVRLYETEGIRLAQLLELYRDLWNEQSFIQTWRDALASD